jgi:hypothetical protein
MIFAVACPHDSAAVDTFASRYTWARNGRELLCVGVCRAALRNKLALNQSEVDLPACHLQRAKDLAERRFGGPASQTVDKKTAPPERGSGFSHFLLGGFCAGWPEGAGALFWLGCPDGMF